jgi:hypothetical protein
MVFPSYLETLDALDVDVLQRRVALAKIGAAIGSPVIGRIGNSAWIGGGFGGPVFSSLPVIDSGS